MSMDIPSSFRRGTAESSSALMDGLISYGRAQSYTSHTSFTSPFAREDDGDDDQDSKASDDMNASDGGSVRSPHDDDNDTEQVDDGALLFSPTYTITPQNVNAAGRAGSPSLQNALSTSPSNFPTPIITNAYGSPSTSISANQQLGEALGETTPLLRKPSISFAHQTPPSSTTAVANIPPQIASNGQVVIERPRKSRRLSTGTTSSQRSYGYRSTANGDDGGTLSEGKLDGKGVYVGGQSTFGQSLFNSIATLLGIGILSEPFAFAKAGWIGGTVLTISYGFLTCHTAKILARLIYSDSRLKTYADCSKKAFGPKSTIITGMFFFIELFTVSVVLVVLFSDSLHEVLPNCSSNTYKLIALTLLIPTSFLPLSVVSYTSLVSVFSTVFIGVVLVFDGLSKPHAPGSMWEGMDTTWGIPERTGSRGLGLSFGIFMAGFAGHAVIPSIARDMKRPEEFDRMINWAFIVTTIVYGTVGAGGYWMFGSSVTDEISRDLLATPGYNVPFTRFGMWMLVISPITKFALSARPLNIMIESLLDIEPPTSSPFSSSVPGHGPEPATQRRRRLSSAAMSDRPSLGSANGDAIVEHQWGTNDEGVTKRSRRAFMFICERIGMVLAIVAVAICVPQFGVIMSLLGAFSAFTLCVTGPLAAEIAINGAGKTRGWRGNLDSVLLVASVGMGAWGTYCAVSDQVRGGI